LRIITGIKLPAMHSQATSNVSVADERNNFSDVIARAKDEAIFVERRGRPAAVVISPEQYERLMQALEDAEDAAAFDEAMAEEGPNIPCAQVKTDLGCGFTLATTASFTRFRMTFYSSSS
jgi:antitoxin Phd